MNSAQIQGIVRWVITVAGGGLAVKNLSSDQFNDLVTNVSTILGSVAALATLFWSVYSNHQDRLRLQLLKSQEEGKK